MSQSEMMTKILFCLVGLFCSEVGKACQINDTILNMNSRGLARRIADGTVVSQEMIKGNFDFASPSLKKLQWVPEEFEKYKARADEVEEIAQKKLGHNRYKSFRSTIEDLFNNALELEEKYVLYNLLYATSGSLMREIQALKDIHPDCWTPDEQISFISDTVYVTPGSSEYITPNESSELGDMGGAGEGVDATGNLEVDAEPELRKKEVSTKRSTIKLHMATFDKNSPCKNSPLFYGRQVDGAEHPLRVICDLKNKTIESLGKVVDAIWDIADRKDSPGIKELVFINGNKEKLKELSPFLSNFVQARKDDRNPVIVVFSTTNFYPEMYGQKREQMGEKYKIPTIGEFKEGLSEEGEVSTAEVATDFTDADVLSSLIGENPFLENNENETSNDVQGKVQLPK